MTHSHLSETWNQTRCIKRWRRLNYIRTCISVWCSCEHSIREYSAVTWMDRRTQKSKHSGRITKVNVALTRSCTTRIAWYGLQERRRWIVSVLLIPAAGIFAQLNFRKNSRQIRDLCEAVFLLTFHPVSISSSCRRFSIEWLDVKLCLMWPTPRSIDKELTPLSRWCQSARPP